jgi:hypothetical protein
LLVTYDFEPVTRVNVTNIPNKKGWIFLLEAWLRKSMKRNVYYWDRKLQSQIQSTAAHACVPVFQARCGADGAMMTAASNVFGAPAVGDTIT